MLNWAKNKYRRKNLANEGLRDQLRVLVRGGSLANTMLVRTMGDECPTQAVTKVLAALQEAGGVSYSALRAVFTHFSRNSVFLEPGRWTWGRQLWMRWSWR